MTREELHNLFALLWEEETANGLDQLAADLAGLDDAVMIRECFKFETQRILAAVTASVLQRLNEGLH
jgi:hypothetical protein